MEKDKVFVLEKEGTQQFAPNLEMVNKLVEEGFIIIGYVMNGKYHNQEINYKDTCFCEKHIYEWLKDLGIQKEIIEKSLMQIRFKSKEDEDYFINFEDLRLLLLNFDMNVPYMTNYNSFRHYLYPTIDDDFFEIGFLEETLKKFQFKKKEIRKILSLIPKIKDYSTNHVYVSKFDLYSIMQKEGYSEYLSSNVAYSPDRNVALDIVLKLIDTNDYSSSISLREVAERLEQLIKIGPKNIELIIEKVKSMADIMEEMNQNMFSLHQDYIDRHPYFVDYINISFDDIPNSEYRKKYIELVRVYDEFKSLIKGKKIKEYAEKYGVNIQKINNKKKEKSKNNSCSRHKAKGKNFKNNSKMKSKRLIRDFIGEQLNNYVAKNLSYAIYLNSKKYSKVDVDELTSEDVDYWLKNNNKLIDKFNNYNKSKYSSITLPFTADIDVMNYLTHIQKKLEGSSTLEAKDYEKELFESYENQKEIYTYIKKRKMTKFVTVIGGIIATLAITSFSGVLNKHSNEKQSESEIATEFQNEEIESTLESVVETSTFSEEKEEIISTENVTHSNFDVKAMTRLASEVEKTLVKNKENQESMATYPGEVIITGVAVKEEDKSYIKEKSFIPIGDYADTIDNANVYSSFEDLEKEENSKKSYFGSNDQIGRKVRAIGLSYENETSNMFKISYDNQEVIEYLANGYEIAGYQIDNNYSFNESGNYVGSEGIYDDEEVVKLVLKR